MWKLKKAAASFCSFILAASLLLSSAAPVFAENSAPPEAQTTQSDSLSAPESAEPDSSTPTEPDSSTPPVSSSSMPPEADSDASSLPESTVSDSAASDTEVLPPENPAEPPADSSTPVDSSSVPPEEELPTEEAPVEAAPFVPLAIESFTSQAELLEDGQARLSVVLNRNDVQVQYQWQVNAPTVEEEPELLFDYSSYSDTSYYFPYADITEAELLEINPDATWPGIEMYLAAVEAAGGDAAAVSIENGTENTIIAQAEAATAASSGLELPNWQPIAGATASIYTFAVDEESAEAVYRCVITITDEAYLAQAAAQMRDVYGPKAEEALESTAAEETDPADASENLPAKPEEAEGEPEEAPADEPALTIETQFITGEAVIAMPMMAAMAADSGADVQQVTQDGPWITGLDSEMEYITADTLATHPEAALTIETQLIIVQAAQ